MRFDPANYPSRERDRLWILADGLGLAGAGTRDTVCGNAFRMFHRRDCKDAYPASITLTRPGLLLIRAGMTRPFFWSPRAKSFLSVTMVD